MKGNRAALTAVVVLVLVVAGWWLFKRKGGGEPVDLIAAFATAEKRPATGTFEVIEADLNGDKKRAIYTVPTSRIIWRMKIPDDAWLRLSLATKPESWDKEGNGVLFRIGVSDGRAFDDLIIQHVDPYNNKGDRRWIPVNVDLSAYAGEQVEVILNTNTSPKGVPDDPRNDMALWGAPGDHRFDDARPRARAEAPRAGARSSTCDAQYRPVRDRDPGRDARRLRQPAIHHGRGGRGARARAGRVPRGRRGDCGVVGDGRAAGRADGARHRPRRRRHHEHVFVFRDRREHRAGRRHAGARRHRSRSPATSIPRPCARRSRRGRGPSSRCTSTGSAPTWIRF